MHDQTAFPQSSALLLRGGGVSGSLEATAALSASMNGSIKETDVMWQPRDTYT